jgi:hypothetical protein
MNKLNTVIAAVVSGSLLVSFSTDPPNGVTGAPGDSLCTECHSPASATLDGTITVEGFPAAITPHETYTLTVVNRNTVGDATRAGFQMTILGPFNTKAGEMSSPSASSGLSSSSGRQYFEHRPAVVYPDSNVVKWTVQWTAPDLAGGSVITCYAAGNIANGNFQNSGDRIRTAQVSGAIITSAGNEIVLSKPTFYPNPGADQILVSLNHQDHKDGEAIFYSLQGQPLEKVKIQKGNISVPDLVSGMYIIECRIESVSYVNTWIRL